MMMWLVSSSSVLRPRAHPPVRCFIPLKTVTGYRFFFLSSLHILASVISCVALCSLVARLRNQEDDSKYIRNIKHHLTFIHKSLSFFLTVKEPCHGIIHTCTRTHTHTRPCLQPLFPLYIIHTTLSKPFCPQIHFHTCMMCESHGRCLESCV